MARSISKGARLAVASLVMGAWSSPRTASADGLEGISLFPIGNRPRAGAELETCGFRLLERRGSYAAAIARLEWQATDRIALRARIPAYTLALEGEPEGTREGLGDTELRLRAHLIGGEPIRVSAGYAFQLPTGSRHAGLGQGALQVVPFASAGYRISNVVVYLTVADALSLAGPSQLRLPNWVDPGTDHELRTTVGTIVAITDKVSASGLVTATTILVDAERGRSLLTSAFQLGTQPDPRLRVVVAAQLPVAGEQRFGWKLNAFASYAF